MSTITNFKNYEDTFYSDVLRSENSSSKTNTKAVAYVTDLDARGRDIRMTFKTDIRQYSRTLSEEFSMAICYFLGSGGGNLSHFTTSLGNQALIAPVAILDKFTMRVKFKQQLTEPEIDEVRNFVVGKLLIISSDSRFYGDSLRDKYLCVEATLTPSETQRPELYSINIDYISSELDSSR